jgi:hypothetical protein
MHVCFVRCPLVLKKINRHFCDPLNPAVVPWLVAPSVPDAVFAVYSNNCAKMEKSGGGRGRGGGRGGGGNRRVEDPTVQLSKSLSFLLRHGAEKGTSQFSIAKPYGFDLGSLAREPARSGFVRTFGRVEPSLTFGGANFFSEGLPIRSDGFALVSDVLKCKGLTKFSVEDLEKVVEGNDKKRFSFGEFDGKRYIRANQGHSMSSVKDLETKKIEKASDLPTGTNVAKSIDFFSICHEYATEASK